MKVQDLKTYHHVGLYYRSESRVPRTARENGLSICTMSVEILLPSDITNSCNTTMDSSDHKPLTESPKITHQRPIDIRTPSAGTAPARRQG